MELGEVLDWLNGAGLNFQWRKETNVGNDPALLERLDGKSLDLGGIEAAIVIPDIHLGVGNDVFRTADPFSKNGARLLKFLQALGTLRDQVGADKFRVVQVGDWYDLYRAPFPTIDLQIGAIEAQYGDICKAARALPVLHCIGNHDAALYSNPGATTSRFGIAQPIGSNRVMAYHGHDSATLEAVEQQNMRDAVLLSFFDLVALVPVLAQIVGFIEMVADQSFQEVWTKGNASADLPWDKAKGMAPVGWTAPWVARSDAAALVKAARGLEYVTNTSLEIVFVGHSHRPGISSAWITAERQVVLIDVGSWTYGRAEIAIVTPDGIGLAAIPV